jgi:hypothetical protein
VGRKGFLGTVTSTSRWQMVVLISDWKGPSKLWKPIIPPRKRVIYEPGERVTRESRSPRWYSDGTKLSSSKGMVCV